MRIVFIPKPERAQCGCDARLLDFYRQSGSVWPKGTKIECDCGRKYELIMATDPPVWKLQKTAVLI